MFEPWKKRNSFWDFLCVAPVLFWDWYSAISDIGWNGYLCGMENIPPCPACQSLYAYAMDEKLICPECAYEWEVPAAEETPETDLVVLDAHGTPLANGDAVVVIKNLPVKGSPQPIKGGTKVKNIRLTDGDHNISCKIEGFGSMSLKSEFVKKA